MLGKKKVKVKNISEGGVYIEVDINKLDFPDTAFSCLRNEKIHISLPLENNPGQIEGIGEARWSQKITLGNGPIEKNMV